MSFLFRDVAPTLDATKTTVDDLAATGSANYTTYTGVNAGMGIWAEPSNALAATSTSQVLLTAAFPIILRGVVVRFGVASTSGTLQLESTPSGTAVGSGTSLLSSTISLAGSANTNAYGTLAAAANTPIPAGTSLSLVLGGTLTNLANCVVTVYLSRANI